MQSIMLPVVLPCYKLLTQILVTKCTILKHSAHPINTLFSYSLYVHLEVGGRAACIASCKLQKCATGYCDWLQGQGSGRLRTAPLSSFTKYVCHISHPGWFVAAAAVVLVDSKLQGKEPFRCNTTCWCCNYCNHMQNHGNDMIQFRGAPPINYRKTQTPGTLASLS